MYDLEVVAEEFNTFFVNVGPDLAGQIPNPTPSDPTPESFVKDNLTSMFLTAVDEAEVIEVVQNCENKTSTDCDGIDMTVLKKVIDGISKPLAYIVNSSFQTGIFPDRMKIAKVIPLYKANNKHHFTNYRPVSLLSQFSKILEKLFNKRLDLFIEKNTLLSHSQYGFRSQRSTSLALLELIEGITTYLDKKLHVLGIFIDLKKAFDTINHTILANKLEKYGIRGTVLQWVRNYLNNRRQFVKMGDTSSSCLDITCGVPQGSVLGPKLFLLYINDIVNVSDLFKFVLFADDTNILYAGDNLEDLLEGVSTELLKLKKWFNLNKLSLNVNKTKLILFGENTEDTQINIQLDGANIERVQEIKFLGTIIDEKISWKPHVKYIHSKLSKSTAVMNKAKYFLDHISLKILYHALISPYLNNGAEVWGNTYKTTIDPLVKIQKRAIRIIHKVGFLEHTHELFLQSKILKFTYLVKFKTGQILFNPCVLIRIFYRAKRWLCLIIS